MTKTKRTFKGGYLFKHFRGTPEETIVPADAPERVSIPLHGGPDGETEASVKTGEEVRAGQLIGTGPVHSPVDGTVVEISKMPAVVIEKKPEYAFGKDAVEKLNGADIDWRNREAGSIEGYIYNSGAASLDGFALPTRYGQSAVAPEEIEHIIIRVTSDELLPFADAVLLPEDGIESFLEGLRILGKVYSRSRVTVAVSIDSKELLQRIYAHLLPDERISLLPVSNKYPQGFDEMLVPEVTGGGFPYGFSAINIGVVVLSVQTVLAVYEAVTTGMPVISRVIALGGTGFSRNLHIEVPVGTPWDTVIEKYGKTDREYRFVRNSLLTGETVEDPSLPVTVQDSALYAIPEARTTGLVPFATPGLFKDSYSNTFPSSLLPVEKKLDTNIHGEGRACISCSFCADACPVRIQPNLLHRYVLREIIEESLVQFGIFKCIECNLCTYVCPSKIPLAELMKKGKQMLRDEGLGNEEEIKAQFTLKGI